MRVVLVMPLLVACIASEPGTETPNATQRKACSELEGLTFQSGLAQGTRAVTFNADDAEYSTYTATADGAQAIGLAQCISVGATTIIYVDGATDHWSARADVSNTASGIHLRWVDGATLLAATP